jgi:hypothetical protein
VPSKKPQLRSPSLYENSLVVPSKLGEPLPPHLTFFRKYSLDNCEAPTYWHQALAYIADLPADERIITQPVAARLKHAEKNLARIAAYNFLNNSFAPVCSMREDWTFTNPEGATVQRLDSCPDAEMTLLMTFDSMQEAIDTGEPDPIDSGWTIVVDDDLEPIAIKKHYGEPSALSLVPLTIDGCEFPAGSLMRMRLHEYTRTNTEGLLSRAWAVMPRHNIASMKFLRLSAFAHNPKDRGIFREMDHSDPNALLTLTEITQLATDCIPLSTGIGFQTPTGQDAGDSSRDEASATV